MTLLISVDILSGDKVQYSAVQYCAELPRSHPLCSEGIQYSTVQSFRDSTVQYSTVLPRSRPLCWEGMCCQARVRKLGGVT